MTLRIWQHAAGDTDRDYSTVCIKFDVILSGPGRLGKWPECAPLLKDKIKARKLGNLRRFYEEIQEGDLIVLHTGTRDAHAIGQVAGKYEYHQEFGDIDGWDLQHVRRVQWFNRVGRRFKDAYTLKFGDTTQWLENKEVREWVEEQYRTVTREELQSRLVALPHDDGTEPTLASVSAFIQDRGLTALTTKEILNKLEEITQHARWYGQHDEDPCEHETLCHLVLPFLRMLGWTPQQIAMEWNDIDIALFSAFPRQDEHLAVVLEAKRRKRSCLAGLEQAKRYAASRPKCNRIVLTDGLTYWVYLRRGVEWGPHARLNLNRLRTCYPVYDCRGAEEAVLAMTPGWASNDS